MENIAEIFIDFLAENTGEKDEAITPRSSLRVTSKKRKYLYLTNFDKCNLFLIVGAL